MCVSEVIGGFGASLRLSEMAVHTLYLHEVLLRLLLMSMRQMSQSPCSC